MHGDNPADRSNPHVQELSLPVSDPCDCLFPYNTGYDGTFISNLCRVISLQAVLFNSEQSLKYRPRGPIVQNDVEQSNMLMIGDPYQLKVLIEVKKNQSVTHISSIQCSSIPQKSSSNIVWRESLILLSCFGGRIGEAILMLSNDLLCLLSTPDTEHHTYHV